LHGAIACRLDDAHADHTPQEQCHRLRGVVHCARGTSYAAIKLPRNSVANKQLRANAVTSSKVRNKTLRPTDFAPGTLRRGVRGPVGPPGATGAAGAVAGPLPSGGTVRGRWTVLGNNTDAGAGDIAANAFSFGAQLAAAPAPVFVFGGPPTAQCPGSSEAPEAAAGVLCIYVEYQVNINSTINTIIGTETGKTSRQGAEVYIVNAAAAVGGYGARGSWAVTAP
jgi:hypothetical protein